MPPPVITPAMAAAELLLREAAEKSLYAFVKQAWHIMEPGNALVDGWYLGATCEHTEAVLTGQIKNLLINQPPRTLKTKVVSIAAPAYHWIKRPQESFACGSYAFTLAKDSSIACRTLIGSPWYRARWANRFSILEGLDRSELFANDKGGQLFITSPDSLFTGRGADILSLDDPNHTKDQSDTMLDATLNWWRRTVPTRVKIFKTARKIVTQQRTSEKDISGDILENFQEEFTCLILPMEFEINRRCVTVVLPSTAPNKWQDPRTKEGELLCEDLIGQPELKLLKKMLGSSYDVAGQLQQRPSPGEGGMIKKSWFPIKAHPARLVIKHTITSVDTSLSDLKSSAYNAATTWGIFEDEQKIPNVILLAMWRDRCEYDVMRKMMRRMAYDYKDDGPIPLKDPNAKRKPDLIIVEDQGFGKEIIKDLARSALPVMRFQPQGKGDKKTRVRAVQGLLESGRVWLPGRAPDFKVPLRNAEIFLQQALSFPVGASRDLVDTMTQALYWFQSNWYVWASDVEAPKEEKKTTYQRKQVYGGRRG